MSTIYTPNPANNPTSITIPSDGDVVDAASVNPAFEGLMDRDSRKIDGVSGGTYNPTGDIVIGGGGLALTTPFLCASTSTFSLAATFNNDITCNGTIRLGSRTVTRVQRNAWDNFEATWSHVDCIGDGTGTFAINNIGSLVFDNTTGAGSATVATKVLDLPDGSSLSSITVKFKAAAGHTAMPTVHPFQFRVIVVDVATGAATPSSFRVDPSASTAAYEVEHDVTQGYGPPIVVDNSAFMYILQAQAESGTGTTAVSGGRVVAVKTSCVVTVQDPGGS